MVSLRLFIEIILFAPLAFGNKLTFQENEERLQKCGQPGGVGRVFVHKSGNSISLISPRHFLASGEAVNNKFDSGTCEKKKNNVTGMLNITKYHDAYLYGDCKDPQAGIILADSNYYQAKDYYCVFDGKLQKGESVYISITKKNMSMPGTAIECDQPNDKKFCVETFADHSGVMVRISRAGRSYITGLISKHLRNGSNNSRIYEGYYVPVDDLCQKMGICNKSIKGNGLSTLGTPKQVPTTPTTPTKPQTTLPTISPPPSTASPDPTSKATSPTVPANPPSPTTSPVQPSTVNLASQPIVSTLLPTQRAEKTTVSPAKVTQTKDSLVSSATKIPASDKKKTQDQEAPHAEKLKQEIDCGEENLCFAEDIFKSSENINISSFLISMFLVILIF